MELTTRGRYAVMAMADLARMDGTRAHPLSQIADNQKLPLSYLEQLFLNLRRAGLVESARGRAGGYRLARSARDISVSDVMAAVEEDTHFTRCNEHGEEGCLPGERCLTHGLWKRLSDVTSDYLKSVSLEDVVAGRTQRGSVASATSATSGTTPARIYLDYNATAPLCPQARDAMVAALDYTGNPSSVHAEGRRARGIIETAREQVAALINAKPFEVVFTSGATEANAWAMAQGFDTVFAAGVEHDSILASARASAKRVIEVPVGKDGLAQVEAIARDVLKRADLGRVAATLQMANNETGTIEPVSDLAHFAREHGLFMHTDAVQAAGRIEIDFAELPVTTLALSAHKMGGPKGVGALVIRDHVDLNPLIRGGGQERRRRAGTENVAAIAGFGAAAVAARAALKDVARIARLRDRLEEAIAAVSPQTLIIGADAPRLANTCCLALPGSSAESLVIKLDLAGIAVSAGSACSSGKVGANHVLSAMGLEPAIAKSAVRVSIGPQTTEHDLAAFVAAWKTIAAKTAAAA
ncbi:MAG: aminotransferase class V-fold PLP-dependent enzyme [Hyphomicrobium sp.]